MCSYQRSHDETRAFIVCQFPEKWLCGSHVEGFSAASSLEREEGISWFQLFHGAPEGPWSLKVQCAGWVKYLRLFWMYHRKSGDMVRCRTLLFPTEAAQNGLHNPDLPQALVPCGPQSLCTRTAANFLFSPWLTWRGIKFYFQNIIIPDGWCSKTMYPWFLATSFTV